MEATYKNENKTNLHIPNHDTNYPIIKLDESFFKIQRITDDINHLEGNT